MALVMKIAKIFFVVAGLKLEVGEIPISNGEIINKDDAFAQIQAKITNTRDGEFNSCLSKDHIGFEIKDGDAVFTCNAKTNSELGGGNKRRKKSKKTKKKKQTKKRKTMKKK
jgi:hypothetical protein